MIAPPRLISLCAILALCRLRGRHRLRRPFACRPGTATDSDRPCPSPTPQEPMTPEKAKADCWMKYESDKKVKNIDQRLVLVEKCVDDTLRNQLVQRPQR